MANSKMKMKIFKSQCRIKPFNSNKNALPLPYQKIFYFKNQYFIRINLSLTYLAIYLAANTEQPSKFQFKDLIDAIFLLEFGICVLEFLNVYWNFSYYEKTTSHPTNSSGIFRFSITSLLQFSKRYILQIIQAFAVGK